MAHTDTKYTKVIKKSNSKHLRKEYMWNYAFILPGVVLLFLFAYLPMAGIQIAFRNFQIETGIWGGAWVGFKNFAFFTDPYFWKSFENTIILTVYRTLINFPAPIIFALIINELVDGRFKKFIQSASYVPFFISWVVIAYLLTSMLALDTGVVNSFIQKLGFAQIFFMGDAKYFRSMIVFSFLWKNMGWGAIIYIAALSNIDVQLLEAAKIDGAGRFSRIWHINLPGIIPTIVILLILTMPALLSAGYEQILPLTNPANVQVSDVLDVYLVRLGFSQAQYSVAAAIGFVLSVMNLLLVLVTNYISKKVSDSSLW